MTPECSPHTSTAHSALQEHARPGPSSTDTTTVPTDQAPQVVGAGEAEEKPEGTNDVHVRKQTGDGLKASSEVTLFPQSEDDRLPTTRVEKLPLGFPTNVKQEVTTDSDYFYDAFEIGWVPEASNLTTGNDTLVTEDEEQNATEGDSMFDELPRDDSSDNSSVKKFQLLPQFNFFDNQTLEKEEKSQGAVDTQENVMDDILKDNNTKENTSSTLGDKEALYLDENSNIETYDIMHEEKYNNTEEGSLFIDSSSERSSSEGSYETDVVIKDNAINLLREDSSYVEKDTSTLGEIVPSPGESSDTNDILSDGSSSRTAFNKSKLLPVLNLFDTQDEDEDYEREDAYNLKGHHSIFAKDYIGSVDLGLNISQLRKEAISLFESATNLKEGLEETKEQGEDTSENVADLDVEDIEEDFKGLGKTLTDLGEGVTSLIGGVTDLRENLTDSQEGSHDLSEGDLKLREGTQDPGHGAQTPNMGNADPGQSTTNQNESIEDLSEGVKNFSESIADSKEDDADLKKDIIRLLPHFGLFGGQSENMTFVTETIDKFDGNKLYVDGELEEPYGMDTNGKGDKGHDGKTKDKGENKLDQDVHLVIQNIERESDKHTGMSQRTSYLLPDKEDIDEVAPPENTDKESKAKEENVLSVVHLEEDVQNKSLKTIFKTIHEGNGQKEAEEQNMMIESQEESSPQPDSQRQPGVCIHPPSCGTGATYRQSLMFLPLLALLL